MASAYKRDDAEFRARIAKLADAGLHLDCTHPRPEPSVPEPSRAAELACGLLAYGVLIACAVVLVKWVILPLWSAL